jgi:hypothetical protein
VTEMAMEREDRSLLRIGAISGIVGAVLAIVSNALHPRDVDDGTEALLEDLTQLTRAIMEEEVDRFVDALARDLIQPEDF